MWMPEKLTILHPRCTMQVPIQHMYKLSHEGSGLLYAWFLSMHTRVDIILYSKKTEGELLLSLIHI